MVAEAQEVEFVDDAPAGYDRPPVGRKAGDGVTAFHNVAVANIRGYRPLHLDLRIPDRPDPPPVVIWIHGGGWAEGSRVSLPEPFAAADFHGRILRRGYAVADVDYRLSREAVFPAQLHDVKAAIRWLRAFSGELGLDADRFVAWGESAGGHLAALAGLTGTKPVAALDGEDGVLGVSSEVAAVVDWYGPADLLGRREQASAELRVELAKPDAADAMLLGGPVSERRDEAMAASPVSYVHPAAPPFLCMHGTADGLVPYSQSEQLAGALRAQNVRCDLYPVEGADHVFVGAPDVGALVEASLDFVDDMFGRGRSA